MSYKRRSVWQDSFGSSHITSVYVHWSQKSSAYMITYSDAKNFNEMMILNGYIKNQPQGEKDVQMDDSSGKKVWTWYLHEKHIIAFNEMVKAMPNHFKLDFIEKPTGQTNMSMFIPVDVYLTKFKNIVGEDIKDIEYDKAKKVYRRWIMKNHPDVGGDSKIASEINTCWTELERIYFKTKKETEYAYIKGDF
jgi:hypothetical protein